MYLQNGLYKTESQSVDGDLSESTANLDLKDKDVTNHESTEQKNGELVQINFVKSALTMNPCAVCHYLSIASSVIGICKI